MDEKFKQKLLVIGRRFADRYYNVQSMSHQHRSENTFAKEVEQAFRDNDWRPLEPQQPAEGDAYKTCPRCQYTMELEPRHGVYMCLRKSCGYIDRTEPQQPAEGEEEKP